MKKLATLAVAVTVASSLPCAQGLSAPARAGTHDALQDPAPAGRIILVPRVRYDVSGAALGAFAPAGGAGVRSAASAALAEVSIPKTSLDPGTAPSSFTALRSFVPRTREEEDDGAVSLGRVGLAGGAVARAQGDDDAFTSLGAVRQAGRPLGREGKTDRSSAASLGGASGGVLAQAGGASARGSSGGGGHGSLGRVSHAGGAQARGQEEEEDEGSLGLFGQVGIGPIPTGYDPEDGFDPNPMLVTQVTLYGRSGSSYALFLQPMGSAAGPAVLIARGLLFGEDPDETPRKLYLRLPPEVGVLLVPID